MKILIVEDERGIGRAMNTEQVNARRVALCFELPADGSLPEWVELLPPGQVITGRDGRTWINDHPEIILQSFAMEGKDLPIDWEHSTELKAPKGEEAPAAGWIKAMEDRGNGNIWGRVEWTERGGSSVRSRENRYLSTVFRYEIDSRRIFRITSAGLTNQPNLYLEALNTEEKETTMELAQLLAALGLPATTTFAQALNHIAKMKDDHATALNQAQNPSLDRFVPRGDYDTALNRATTAETQLQQIREEQLVTAINSEIDAALKAGKITPATVEYHTAQCRQEGGLDRFKAFVAAAPVVAGASDLDERKTPTDTALNSVDQKVCDLMGISIDDYKKTNNLK